VLEHGLSEGEDAHVSVLVHVDEQVLNDPSAPGCAHLEGLGAITAHAAARLACDGALSRLLYRADGSVEPTGTTRVVPATLRRALYARDRGCRFPSCGATRFLHAHHVVFVTNGGKTALSNLVSLCGTHHRLVHDGGWRLKLAPSGAVRVFSPAGTELPVVAPALATPTETLEAALVARGLVVDPDGLAGDGDRLDLGLAIDGLFGLAGRS
jgi:hypothetical protein